MRARRSKKRRGKRGPFSLEKVIEKLKTVFDPEIPVNVVDLGLIYVCEAHPLADGGHRVEIKMSMTAPGCGIEPPRVCRRVIYPSFGPVSGGAKVGHGSGRMILLRAA